MSFLDDLKRQADELRARQATDQAASARDIAITEAACKAVHHYLMALAPQLEVLKPVSPARFVLDRQHVFQQLPMTEFRVDARMLRIAEPQRYDHVVMHWQLKTGRALDIRKDFVPDIEALEPRLRASGATIDHDAVRDPETGKLKAMRYRLVADFVGSLKVVPEAKRTALCFEMRNLDGFESLHFELPATAIDTPRLDELARWMVGQPHRFLDGAQQLRRVVA